LILDVRALKKDGNFSSFISLATHYLDNRKIRYEIVLFGSKVEPSLATEVSDTDILFIIDSTNVGKHEWKEINRFLISLDLTYLHQHNSYPLFLKTLNNLTGMFKNVFISSYDSLSSREFVSMFSVSRLASFLIPEGKILKNIQLNHIHVAGDHYLDAIEEEIKTSTRSRAWKKDRLKSLLLNLLLSMGSLAILLFFKEATLYSMEAVKWSLLNTANYKNMKRLTTFKAINERLKVDQGLTRKLFIRLILLRKSYNRDPFFTFFSPFLVTTIHLGNQME